MSLAMDPFLRRSRLLPAAMLILAGSLAVGLSGRRAHAADALPPSGPQNTSGNTPVVQLKAISNQLEVLFPLLEEMYRLSPRDTFDPDAVIEETGRDADKLFA